MKIMKMPNAICLAGNHEYMALQCLPFLMKEITEMSIDQLNEKMLNKFGDMAMQREQDNTR